jgi:hypothetical protein
MRQVANDETMSLRAREKIVNELAAAAADDLGLAFFPAARQFLETLGMRRLVVEGQRLPPGARRLGSPQTETDD